MFKRFCFLAAASLVSCVALAADIRVANLNDYIDPALLSKFTAETGLSVDYVTVASGGDLMALLERGDALDVAVARSNELPKLIEQKLVQPYGAQELPGFMASEPMVRSRVFIGDKSQAYAAPYFWGRIGLLVDPVRAEKALGEPLTPSLANVFSAAKLQKLSSCGVSLLDEPDEVATLYLNYKGELVQRTGARLIREMSEQLQAVRPLYQSVSSSAYVKAMAAGELCVALAWEGDSRKLLEGHPNLQFVLPSEGTVIFVDTLVVPTHAANLEGAKKFITFMLRPENALQNARFTRFNPANSEALAELNRSTNSRPVVSSAAVPLFGTIEPPAEVEPLLDESWDAFAKGAPLDH